MDNKLIILGEATVGKTSIAHRLYINDFSDIHETTIGASFFKFNIDKIKFEVWDTAGQERYRSLLPMYFRNCNIALLVYDLSNISESIKAFDYFLNKLIDPNKNCVIIILGNKMDLINDDDIVPIKNTMPKKMKELYGDTSTNFIYQYVSAKSGDGFDDLRKILHECGEEIAKKKIDVFFNNFDSVKLNQNPNKDILSEKNYCGC